MDSDAHIPFDFAGRRFSVRTPKRCDFPRFAQGRRLQIGDSRGRDVECQTKPICPARRAKRTQFPRFWAENEGHERKQSQSRRAGGLRLGIGDWGLEIRGGGAWNVKQSQFARPGVPNEPNSTRVSPGRPVEAGKSEARNSKQARTTNDPNPRNAKQSQSAPAGAPNEPNSGVSGPETGVGRDVKRTQFAAVLGQKRGPLEKTKPVRVGGRLAIAIADWGFIVVDLSWTSMPAEATLERTFFIAAAFLVLDPPGELDRRQVFMELRELV